MPLYEVEALEASPHETLIHGDRSGFGHVIELAGPDLARC